MLEKVLVVVDGVLIQTLVVMFLVVAATVILPVQFIMIAALMLVS